MSSNCTRNAKANDGEVKRARTLEEDFAIPVKVVHPAAVGDRFHKSDYDMYRIDGERCRCDYTQLVEVTEVADDGFAYEVVALVSETNAPPADYPMRRNHGAGSGRAMWVALSRFQRVH